MVGCLSVYAKKIFSLSLIFSSLITILVVAGILFGYYRAYPHWQPYAPYLLNGNIFWFAIVAALVNLFPSAKFGRALKTGRFLFHHYVYGFLVMLSSAVYVLAFTSVSFLSLFLVENTSTELAVGRFFVLGGLTLVLDDLPDVSKRIESFLNWLKSKAYQGRRIIHVLQLITSIVCFYLFISMGLYAIQDPEWIIGNAFTMTAVLFTCIIAFVCVKRKVWLNLQT